MKKIRYIPYGYTMRNGRTVIAQDEAMVIREIFSAYINGASLQSIAELLTERKIPYSERTPNTSEMENMTPSSRRSSMRRLLRCGQPASGTPSRKIWRGSTCFGIWSDVRSAGPPCGEG